MPFKALRRVSPIIKPFLDKGFRVFRTPYFLIKYTNNQLSHHRIMVIISAAAVSSAVQRNFLRRQIKRNLIKLPDPYRDMMVIVNKKINLLTKSSLQKEIKKPFHN